MGGYKHSLLQGAPTTSSTVTSQSFAVGDYTHALPQRAPARTTSDQFQTLGGPMQNPVPSSLMQKPLPSGRLGSVPANNRHCLGGYKHSPGRGAPTSTAIGQRFTTVKSMHPLQPSNPTITMPTHLNVTTDPTMNLAPSGRLCGMPGGRGGPSKPTQSLSTDRGDSSAIVPVRNSSNQAPSRQVHPPALHPGPERPCHTQLPSPLSVKGLQDWVLVMKEKYMGVSKSRNDWNMILQQEIGKAGGTEDDVPLSYVNYVIQCEIIPGLLQDDPLSQTAPAKVLLGSGSVDPWSEEMAPVEGDRVVSPRGGCHSGPSASCDSDPFPTMRRSSALHYQPPPNQLQWPELASQHPSSKPEASSQEDYSVEGLPSGWFETASDSSEYNPSADIFGSSMSDDADQGPVNSNGGALVGRQGNDSKFDLAPTPYPQTGAGVPYTEDDSTHIQRQQQGEKKRSVSFADEHPPKKARQDTESNTGHPGVPSLLSMSTRPPISPQKGNLKPRYDEASYGSRPARARAPKLALYIAGPDSILSNMRASTIFWKGRTFRNGEMKYQYDKKMTVGDKDDKKVAEKILDTTDPFTAKKMGRLSGKKARAKRKAWGKHKIKKQVLIWQLRDAQDPAFAEELKASGDRPLVHNVADPFWGNHRWKYVKVGEKWVKKQEFDGYDMYGRLLMAFREARYGTGPDYNLADASQRAEYNRHLSLCNMVKSYMIKSSEIPKLNDDQRPTGPPPSTPQKLKVLLGDSLLNDKGERKRHCRDLQRECRRACKDDKIFVASEPGITLERLRNEADEMLQAVPHRKPEEVTDVAITGGVNDVLNKLQEWKKFEDENKGKFVSREEREKQADAILQYLRDTVKAVKTSFPDTTIHITKILNHPIIQQKRYGFHLRDYINKKITSDFHSHPVISHHFTPAAWKESHDGLHLSLTAKKEYGDNLAAHFQAKKLFREPRQ